MPVPSSYNDITTSKELRDHVGAVWYERSFYVPWSWQNQRVFLRFGSVHYLAQVVSSIAPILSIIVQIKDPNNYYAIHS